ncbi:MAG TPA: galactokinase [Candidatus Methylacidiphilales bacterium]|jgi:galactokinase|nr:galactokinase [Candidatus Methylacidiphilales bacterium]
MNSITTYAPGRAELLGNHTDYNEGYVLALAVDLGTTITGHARGDRTIHIHSCELGKTEAIALDKLAAEGVAPWSRYALGVVDQFRRNDLPVEGFQAEITGNLPLGAGLSSSASLENATVLFLAKLFGAKLEPLQMARLAQKAEHDFVGVRCGLLDQISSLMSKAHHATFIDCRTMAVDHVPLDGRLSVILANSNVKHALVGGEYNERRSDCEAAAHALGVKSLRDVSTETIKSRKSELADRIYRRALHITGENERVLEGCATLRKGDVARFGKMMFESHESSMMNFENSCPELDRLVEAARKTPGVYGARLSGGGFGGATINLVEKGRENEIVKALTAALPEATCLVTCASDGALEYAGRH